MGRFYKKKKRFKRRRRKWIIQIKSRRNGWTNVELLEIKKGNRMKIKMPSGEIVIRKMKRMRWHKVKRVVSSQGSSGKIGDLKKFRSKKKRNKIKHRRNRNFKRGRKNAARSRTARSEKDRR